jgi:hypothetical protein
MRQLRVLQWRVPLYGQFEQWKAGEPRPVIPSLYRFGEAVKRYLGIELPAGMVPNNTHFFPTVSPASPEEAFTGDRCGIPGLQVAWSEANQLVDTAHVLYVDYPFVMGGERGMDVLPDLRPDQAAVLYFEGESAEHYPWVGSTAFQRYFNATIGSPRGFFDFPATTGYMSKPHQLEGVPSQQVRLVQAAHPRWLQEAALPAPGAESAQQHGDDGHGAPPEDEALVAVMISNCGAPSFRLQYLEELMSHIRVDSYGGCLHSRDIPASLKEQHGQVSKTEYFQGDWRGLKVDLFKRYPFVLAFENANCYDSVTEKVYDPLLAGAVPIYMGAPNIADFVPRHSIIDTRWFSGPAELAAYLRVLISDPQQYVAYHAWRNETAADWPWMVNAASGAKLCDVIRLKHAEQCT